MTHKSLADRLQAGFEAVPLTGRGPAVPRKPEPPWVRKMNRGIAIGTLVFLGLTFVVLTIDAIASNIWWNTKADMVCVVASNDSYRTYGKSGYLGTVYDIDTTTCGQLQVTAGGGGLDEPEAESLGQSLQIGRAYEMDVRGWVGWPDEPRAIVVAKPIG